MSPSLHSPASGFAFDAHIRDSGEQPTFTELKLVSDLLDSTTLTRKLETIKFQFKAELSQCVYSLHRHVYLSPALPRIFEYDFFFSGNPRVS